MHPRCSSTFLPFLYPSFFRTSSRLAPTPFAAFHTSPRCRTDSDAIPTSRLNPAPDDYAPTNFADKARLTVHAGPGGHGCISFVRELFIPEGPPNGGDGGHGGNVYIQAVHGQTSLHKIARRRILRAGRGKTGQGSSRGGARGNDVVIEVPVGTVVKEVERHDPMIEEQMRYRQALEQENDYQARLKRAEDAAAEEALARGEDPPTVIPDLPEPPAHPNLDKFVLYPGISHTEKRNLTLPRIPRRDRLYDQPDAPIHMDLSSPTPRPLLLAAGGLGGLGNPHFVSKERPRPLFATRGEAAVTMKLEFELKLLADVGLVGLPNAGKSTLLRSLTRSRTRVGHWAFTTLQPNIGTVVLDNNKGRPVALPRPKPSRTQQTTRVYDAERGPVLVLDDQGAPIPANLEPRTRFTVADIPGLIEGAHLDRGLGIAFLRHVERAGVLAFVVDLSAGDAVTALKSLWNEVGLYARMREEEEHQRELDARIDWAGDGVSGVSSNDGMALGGSHTFRRHIDPSWGGEPKETVGLHIAAKPWFVVATKADLPETEENFARLQTYLADVTAGAQPHPSGIGERGDDKSGDGKAAAAAEQCWTRHCAAIPVSAIHGHGVERFVHWTAGLLDD